MTPTYLNKLNKQQRRAVKHGVKDDVARPARPLLILAGAGTGKTLTLATRVAYLLLSGALPSSMLVCSYTRRSSKELVARVRSIYREATGRNVNLPYAGTFHSVALALLREFAQALGLKSGFSVIDESDAEDLMEQVRKRCAASAGKRLFPTKKQCRALYSYMANACLSLNGALREKYSHLTRWLAKLQKLFATYSYEKRSQRFMDYDDLLVELSKALKHPTVGPILRGRFKYVLIDEYQDTNRLQLKILRRLKPDGIGVTAVGDDAQAIYSFRAATVANIRQFDKSFTQPARVVTLEENYRSTQPILAASNAVISLSDAIVKKLFSKHESKRLPRLVTVNDELAQADYVVREVLRARRRSIPFNQQAILFRTAAQIRQAEVALKAARIPFQMWGGTKFLDTAHVRDVLAMLRWWENPRDRLSAFRVLKLLDGLGDRTVFNVLEDIDPRRLVQSLAAARPDRATRKQWAKLVQLLKKSREGVWPTDLEAVVAWYPPYLAGKFEDKADDRADSLRQLVDIAATFSSRADFLTEVAMEPPEGFVKQGGTKPFHADILTLSTIHSAKGHEWSKVMLISAVEGCLPLSQVTDTEGIEEERRLLYVAMTRAKSELDVIAPRRIFQAHQRFPIGNLHVQRTQFLAPSVRKKFALVVNPRG